MIQKPGVRVWIAPPTANIIAPTKSVPLRPRLSPMRPAASDVTGQIQSIQFSNKAAMMFLAY